MLLALVAGRGLVFGIFLLLLRAFLPVLPRFVGFLGRKQKLVDFLLYRKGLKTVKI
jgi:hypothetical protein